jgi:peptidoglycan/LPS O-acetylase OafA/YrhL
MTASINRPYFPEVDHLRCYAALLVLAYHGLHLLSRPLIHGTILNDPATEWIYTNNPLFAVLIEGHSGVGLFIVLSGFILTIGAVGKQIDFGRFIVARALRIYPLYLLLLVVAIHSYPQSSLTTLTASLLPISNVPGVGAVNGVFGAMFWTVAVEVQCYLLFPYLLAFSNEQGSIFLWKLILVATLFCALAVLAVGANPQLLTYSTICGRIIQFCVGMAIARWFVVDRKSRPLHVFWFLPAMALIVLSLFGFHKVGGWPSKGFWRILWPLAEALIWSFFVITYISMGRKLPVIMSSMFRRLGEISYSIYLIHFSLFAVVVRHDLYLKLTGNGYWDSMVTTFVVVVPVTIVISMLTYSTIEAPFLRRRSRYLRDGH